MKTNKTLIKIEKNQNYELWKSEAEHLYIVRKKASRRTIIHLKNDGTLVWEQFYLFGGRSRPSSVKTVILKPKIEKGVMPIVFLKGTPLMVKGLDDGAFVSSKERYKEGKILFINNYSI